MTTTLLILAWLAPARAEDPGALLYLARAATTPGAPAEVALAWPEGAVTDVALEAGDGARLGAVARTPTGARVVAWPEGSARQGSVRARVQGKDGAWHDMGPRRRESFYGLSCSSFFSGSSKSDQVRSCARSHS